MITADIPPVAPPAYIPGVCNINKQEATQRRRIGHGGVLLTIVMMIVLYILQADTLSRYAVFLPATLAASGYLQAYRRFCVGYAGAKRQNASEGSRKTTKVIDKDAIKKDSRRAFVINLQTIAIATVVTLVYVLLLY